MLSSMSDAVARLNAALEGRYAIERELGEGGNGDCPPEGSCAGAYNASQ